MLIEVATFSLVDGTDRAAFLSADHQLQEELNGRPGFVRRTTAEGEHGWVVITLWADEASATAAANVIVDHEFSGLVRDIDSRQCHDIGG